MIFLWLALFYVVGVVTGWTFKALLVERDDALTEEGGQ